MLMPLNGPAECVKRDSADDRRCVLTTVITGITDKDVGDVADGALGVGVVGSRAVHPGVAVRNVDLAFSMGESKETARNDRDEVLPSIQSQRRNSTREWFIAHWLLIRFISAAALTALTKASLPTYDRQHLVHTGVEEKCLTRGMP
jgi:hypothetical protein